MTHVCIQCETRDFVVRDGRKNHKLSVDAQVMRNRIEAPNVVFFAKSHYDKTPVTTVPIWNRLHGCFDGMTRPDATLAKNDPIEMSVKACQSPTQRIVARDFSPKRSIG